jgi:hypothetical protein
VIQYKIRIVDIFKNYNSNLENGRPGIRWAFEPIKKKTKYLILGINPSNSFNKANSVIQKSGNKWFKGKFKNQEEYDRFLTNEENEYEITLLQELAHEHHPHFKKHKKFITLLKSLEDYNCQFFDLFPVWEIKQKDFIDDLKDDEKEESINAFKELIDRHPNIECLLFFNAGAADFFMKENKTKWDSEKKVNVREDNDKRERSSIVKKGEIELENRDIDVYSFGIGGYFGDKEMEKLAQIWN